MENHIDEDFRRDMEQLRSALSSAQLSLNKFVEGYTKRLTYLTAQPQLASALKDRDANAKEELFDVPQQLQGQFNDVKGRIERILHVLDILSATSG